MGLEGGDNGDFGLIGKESEKRSNVLMFVNERNLETYLTPKIQSASSSLTKPSIYTTNGSLFSTYTPLYLCSSHTSPFSGIFKLDKFLFPAYDAPLAPPPPSKFDNGAPAKIYAIAPKNAY